MIFLFMFYILLFLCVLDSESYSIYPLCLFASFILSVFGLAHMILLSTVVYRDAAEKNIGSKAMWALLTFAAGIPMAGLYGILSYRAGKYKNKSAKKRNIIHGLVSVAAGILFVLSTPALSHFSDNYRLTHFTKDTVTYENASGDDIIYDKAGNSYTADKRNQFRYYDRNGNSYMAVTSLPLFNEITEIDSLQCIETNAQYVIYDDYQFYIDKDGYLIITPNENDIAYNDSGAYCDSDGNIYYNIEDCYWTPDGRLITAG